MIQMAPYLLRVDVSLEWIEGVFQSLVLENMPHHWHFPKKEKQYVTQDHKKKKLLLQGVWPRLTIKI